MAIDFLTRHYFLNFTANADAERAEKYPFSADRRTDADVGLNGKIRHDKVLEK